MVMMLPTSVGIKVLNAFGQHLDLGRTAHLDGKRHKDIHEQWHQQLENMVKAAWDSVIEVLLLSFTPTEWLTQPGINKADWRRHIPQRLGEGTSWCRCFLCLGTNAP